MKSILIFLLVSTVPLYLKAQTTTPDFGTCFSKANKKSIHNKMEDFVNMVSEDTKCPKEKITYQVTEYYTTFYSKKCRHLPKKITIEACGEKRTYIHDGLSGAVLYWLLGSWKLEKSNNL